MKILHLIEELKETNDNIVIALACNGELVAMEELIRRQHKNVRQFMSRLCFQKETAEDLSQQVFLKLWRTLPNLKKPDTYYAWQKMIMINVWKDYLRQQKIDFSDDVEVEKFSAIRTEHSSLNMDLNRALYKLPPSKRLCIVLAYHEGLTHPQIAEFSNIPLGTVKSNITRGTQELKLLLSDYLPSQNERVPRGKNDE